jgi:hypothetical protein
MSRAEQALTKPEFAVRGSYRGADTDTDPFVGLFGEGEGKHTASIKAPYVFCCA